MNMLNRWVKISVKNQMVNDEKWLISSLSSLIPDLFSNTWAFPLTLTLAFKFK